MNSLSISSAPNGRLPANIAPVAQTMNRTEGPHLGNLGAAGRSGPENCCYCLAQTALCGGVMSAATAGPVLMVLQPRMGPGLAVCACSVLTYCFASCYVNSRNNDTP